MIISISKLKARQFLQYVYFKGRTSIHSKHIAFFAISDDKEIQMLTEKLNINRIDLFFIVDLLFEAGLIKFFKLLNTVFIFLTEEVCDFLLRKHEKDIPCILKDE